MPRYEFADGQVAVSAESLDAAERHLERFHPDIAAAYRKGEVVVVSDDPTEAEVLLGRRILLKFGEVYFVDRFEVENRLRVLEGKAAITREQFLDAVKARLGL